MRAAKRSERGFGFLGAFSGRVLRSAALSACTMLLVQGGALAGEAEPATAQRPSPSASLQPSPLPSALASLQGATQEASIPLPTLKVWGAVRSLLDGFDPWRGFDADAPPVLTVARAQRIATQRCERWVAALMRDQLGDPAYEMAADEGSAGRAAGAMAGGGSRSWSWRAWEPWTEDELDYLRECEKLPCDVKLNGTETALMAAVPVGDRKTKFLTLILGRAKLYERGEERAEHEFPGAPVDPWKLFDDQGFRSRAPRPAHQELRLRRLDFAPGKIKPIRQVLDERSSETVDRREATYWVRDVYTDHYFDSWGEWADVRCDPAGGSVWITQGVIVEVDQLKKNDLISRIMRGQIKGAIETAANQYLDRWVERLRKRAEP